MNVIDNITDQANQVTQVILADGTVLQLTLIYRATTQRWTMDISHPLLTVNGMEIVEYPNMLRQWRNLISFGLACLTTNGLDPVNIEDFVNGNATLYILNEADVQAVETDVFGGLLQ